MSTEQSLSVEQSEALLESLEERFEQFKHRHLGIEWAKVYAKIMTQPTKLWSLNAMEATGGEPDVVGYDPQVDQYIFFDCSPESPTGRRSICYDRAGLESRKAHQPANTAQDLATEFGITLLNEADYRLLQTLGAFDTKTSSWLQTPAEIRKLGGAIFGDRRYNQVFIYHNGAESYYAARGFRGVLRI